MDGTGTQQNPYLVEMGLFTAIKIKAIEWHGLSVTGKDPDAGEQLFRALTPVLKGFSDGDCFKLIVTEPGGYKDPRLFQVGWDLNVAAPDGFLDNENTKVNFVTIFPISAGNKRIYLQDKPWHFDKPAEDPDKTISGAWSKLKSNFSKRLEDANPFNSIVPGSE